MIALLLGAGERGSPVLGFTSLEESFCLTELREEKEGVVLVQIPQILAALTKF